MICPVCKTEHNQAVCPNCGQRAYWDINDIKQKNERGQKKVRIKRKLVNNRGYVLLAALMILVTIFMFIKT